MKKTNKPILVEMFSGIGSQAKALKKLGFDYDIYISDWDISAFYAYDIIHYGSQKDEIHKYNDLSRDELINFLTSK